MLGWAGPNGKSSQVYVTKLGADGSKVRQKTVTKVTRQPRDGLPNEVYDVDVAVTPSGEVICTWADTRDGNPEIYVARTNRQLERQKREVRLTNTEGPSVEPQLILVGDEALVAFSEATGDDADIHLARLAIPSLERRGDVTRVHDSEGRSHQPRWVGEGAGSLALTWLDEEPEDRAVMRLLALDDHGKSLTAVRTLTVVGGTRVTSGALACTAKQCRGVVSALGQGRLLLGALETRRELGAPVNVTPLVDLAGGTDQELGLTLAATDASVVVFVRDRGAGSLLRRLDLRW
ncbi:MAG: hypothetical protein R3B72_51095 [Polyangiaceae bacterium]